MPHLHIEIARRALERRVHGLTVQVDDGAGPDILAPPFPVRRSVPTSLGIVRVQLIVRSVVLQSVVGSAQCRLALTFDEGSVEVLSAGQSEGLLAGSITIPFTLRFMPAQVDREVEKCGVKTVEKVSQARLVVDFAGTSVGFAFDAASKGRLVAKVGQLAAGLAETAIATALTLQFGSLGSNETGVDVDLTPGVPSEQLLTAEALPGVVWVDPESLALSLRYAAEPVPAPFQAMPFLPAGQPAAFGLRLSSDGFQRAVRNPAIRRLARDRLSARLIDRFVREAYVKRSGTGPITQQDRDDGKNLLCSYLETPQGLLDLANETPAPVGGGKLRQRVSPVPDPFSDFDIEVPELDLWLGNDRIEGRARVTGEVNGFGFTANLRFRGRPVLVQQPLSIEIQNVEIDDPDIEIALPPWLEWAFGALVGVFAGPVTGVIAGFLLSSVIASLVEAFIPADLGSKVPPLPGRRATLPRGVTLTELTVVPQSLTMLGRWSFSLTEDPRPFQPRVAIVDQIVRTAVGPPREGHAYFSCLGDLGFVADSTAEWGTRFAYTHRNWRSTVTARVEATAVPLPLTRFSWTIALGYRSMSQYRFPHLTTAPQPLVAGQLAFTTDVWHPEPPLRGHVASASFSIGVQRGDEDRFTIDVPADAGCILIELATKVVDASGYTWNLSTIIDVPNETVVMGEGFDEFTRQCESGRREFPWVVEPTRLDKVWNPPDVFATSVQHAIRTEQPAVSTAIATVLETRGVAGLNLILAPSQMRRG